MTAAFTKDDENQNACSHDDLTKVEDIDPLPEKKKLADDQRSHVTCAITDVSS